MSVTFIRHAESLANAGPEGYVVDCPLSENGIKQAGELQGKCELIIISPLRRCRQTLLSSKIQYRDMMVSHLCREYRPVPNHINNLEGETPDSETLEELGCRIKKFGNLLTELTSHYGYITVIAHHDFIWHFTSRNTPNGVVGCSLNNAQFINLNLKTVDKPTSESSTIPITPTPTTSCKSTSASENPTVIPNIPSPNNILNIVSSNIQKQQEIFSNTHKLIISALTTPLPKTCPTMAVIEEVDDDAVESSDRSNNLSDKKQDDSSEELNGSAVIVEAED